MKLKTIFYSLLIFGGLYVLNSCQKEASNELVTLEEQLNSEASPRFDDCLAFYCDPDLLNNPVSFLDDDLNDPNEESLGDVLTTYFSNRCFDGGCALLNPCEQDTIFTTIDSDTAPFDELFTLIVPPDNLQSIKNEILQLANQYKPSSKHEIQSIEVYADVTPGGLFVVFLEIKYAKSC